MQFIDPIVAFILTTDVVDTDTPRTYQKISAIKDVRAGLRIGLKEAKDLVEASEGTDIRVRVTPVQFAALVEAMSSTVKFYGDARMSLTDIKVVDTPATQFDYTNAG